MRITGYGTGFGQSGESRDRAAAFRARHSIGQRVKGRILRREQNGLTWVQVGGEELLARLEVEAEPGDELMFIVRALTPDIQLQALATGAQANDLPGLVQRFRSAREVFETQDAELLQALRHLPPVPDLRQEAFQQALAGRTESNQRLDKVLGSLTQINAIAAATQPVRALYLPWLVPGLRRQEMLQRRRTDGSTETALSAVEQDCGALEARLLQGPEAPRLTLSAQFPERSGPVQVELASLARQETGQEPLLLGPMRLRPSPLGGVLGELFGDVPGWSSGGLNTRV